MPLRQLAFMFIVAGVVTLPVVRSIPRARQSPAFDRLLWIGTFTIAFLGAWLALGYLGPPLSDFVIRGVAWVSILLGSVGSAIALNLLLWLLDLLERPGEDEGNYEQDDAGG